MSAHLDSADSAGAADVARSAAWLTRLGREPTAEAVAALAPYLAGAPVDNSPASRAWAHLVRRGKTPTPEAVRRLVELWTDLNSASAALAGGAARAAADYVTGYVVRNGTGPTWAMLFAHMRWSRPVGNQAMAMLRRDGWLTYTTEPGSLRPGARCATEDTTALMSAPHPAD